MESIWYVVGVMLVVPQLCCDEELFAGDAAFLDRLTYCLFSAVANKTLDSNQFSALRNHEGQLRATYTRAVSMCRYPAFIASVTASS